MITELQTEALTMPRSGRAATAVPGDGAEFTLAESTTVMLARSDDAPLDEFVSRCLAQLRQVMDGLQ